MPGFLDALLDEILNRIDWPSPCSCDACFAFVAKEATQASRLQLVETALLMLSDAGAHA